VNARQKQRGGGWGIAAVYVIPSVFLSAFLIFQVQPIIGKHILPWYGGTPAVWTTCLLFFQTLLLVGYAYAHISTSRLRVRWQVSLHLALLVAALFVSVLPGKSWQPQGGEYPLFHITLMLLATVGLPFVALSASGPLLQAWYARLDRERTPYYLYAASNAGSLLALLTYPFLIEPSLSVTQQATVWRWAFVVFIALCAVVASVLWRRPSSADAPPDVAGRVDDDSKSPADAPRRAAQWLWIAWSACAVILFMAVTNLLTLNIAAMPLLWILPLSVYLISFVVSFSSARTYNRRLFALLLVAALAVFAFALPTGLTGRDPLLNTGIVQKIVLASVALFVCCMVCSGELYRLRPDPSRLTRYYLSIAVGGALGGFVVAVVAPSFFLMLEELQLGLALCVLLYIVSISTDPGSGLRGKRYRWVLVPSIVGVIVVAAWTWILTGELLSNAVYTHRDFFGLVRVKEIREADPSIPLRREIYSGNTLHGLQIVHPKWSRLPTTYFGSTSGVGLLMSSFGPQSGRHIGIIGMGVGTLSAYGRDVDEFTYYELNPAMAEVARDWFTFLRDSPARHEIHLGDGRLNLEREPDQDFDILILDAFNSDSIPMHLLTVEAMDVYERHVKPNGVIAIHITNSFIDLFPLVFNLAEDSGFHALGVVSASRMKSAVTSSSWALLCRDPAVLRGYIERAQPLQSEGLLMLTRPAQEAREKVGVWTDGFSNISGLMTLDR